MNELFIEQIISLIADEPDMIANMANISAALNDALEDINWVGFYLLKDDTLVLGPFQGHPACVRIPLSKGVCGKAASMKETVRVRDVHQFPGHIACDAASQSEIVIPLIRDDTCFAVLDIDAPIKNRFSSDDQAFLERLVTSIIPYL